MIPLDASGEDDGGERRFVGEMLVSSSQANRRVMRCGSSHRSFGGIALQVEEGWLRVFG